MPTSDRFGEHFEQAVREITELVQQLVDRDRLTALPGKLAFERDMSRVDGPVGLLSLEINGVKNINSVHGHEGGDWVLSEVARRLEDTVDLQPLATAYHLSGDEFSVIQTGADREGITALAQLVKARVEAEPYGLPSGADTAAGEVTVSVAVEGTDASAGYGQRQQAWGQLDRLTEFQKARGLTDRVLCLWEMVGDRDFESFCRDVLQAIRRRRFRCRRCESEGYATFTARATSCPNCSALVAP